VDRRCRGVGGGARGKDGERHLLDHRLGHRVVHDHVPGIPRRVAEESDEDLTQRALDLLRLFAVAHHVDQDVKGIAGKLLDDHLHERVGVREGGGFRLRHHHRLVTGQDEAQHRVADARAGVDEEKIHPVFDLA